MREVDRRRSRTVLRGEDACVCACVLVGRLIRPWCAWLGTGGLKMKTGLSWRHRRWTHKRNIVIAPISRGRRKPFAAVDTVDVAIGIVLRSPIVQGGTGLPLVVRRHWRVV